MPPQQRNNYIQDCYDSPSSSKSPVHKVKVQKRFRFALSANEIFPIPHIDDLSDEEVFDTWYERSDYEKIKMSMIPFIRMIMRGEEVEENDEQTIRGLEYRTREGATLRQKNKLEAITALLDEQDRQYEFAGFTNDVLLSKVYRQVNAHCQREAHELALGDVQPAREHCGGIDALDLHVRLQQKREHSRRTVQRKQSFGKMFKQMRIRRKPSVTDPTHSVVDEKIAQPAPIASIAA